LSHTRALGRAPPGELPAANRRFSSVSRASPRSNFSAASTRSARWRREGSTSGARGFFLSVNDKAPRPELATVSKRLGRFCSCLGILCLRTRSFRPQSSGRPSSNTLKNPEWPASNVPAFKGRETGSSEKASLASRYPWSYRNALRIRPLSSMSDTISPTRWCAFLDLSHTRIL